MTVNTWTRTFTPVDVAEADDPFEIYAHYVRQNVGTPGASKKDLAVLRKKVKQLFEQEPRLDWYSMCRVAQWARAKKRRPPHVHLMADYVKYAWADKYLPELDPDHEDDSLEQKIERALNVEEDAWWRRRLIMTKGVQARTDVYREWRVDWQERGNKLPQPKVDR